jgi:hypothetical protein
MKRIFFIAILLTVLLCRTPPVEGTMTYGLTFYESNRGYIGAGNFNDPLWRFINEVETTIDGTSGITALILTPGSEPSTPSEGQIYYDSAGNNLKLYNGSAWVDIDVAGASSLNTAYGVGSKISAGTLAVEIEVADGSNNSALLIDHDEATNDNDAMQITNAADAATAVSLQIDGTAGFDIQGTGDVWNVTIAGVATLPGIILGGTDMVMENGDTFNNVDDDVFEFSSNDKEDFEIDLSGTNIVKFTSDSSAITLEFDSLDRFTGVEDITFDAEAGNITLTADAGAEDLTISQAGAVDASLILTSAGTGTDALSLISTAADISLVSADNITRTAADNITDVTTDGGYTLTIGGATNGDYAMTAADEASMISVGAFTIQNTEAASDITINSVLGSIAIEAEEDAASAVLITADGGTSSTLKIHNDTGTSTTEGAASLQLTSDVGSIELLSGLNAADAINIMVDASTAAGITIFNDTGTACAATTETDGSIQLLSDAGGIGITSTANLADAIRIEANGGASETVAISSVKGTGAASIDIDSTVGGITIAANAAGKDVDIDSVLGSILIEAEEDSATAISIIADGGTTSGIWIQNDTGTSVTEDTASVEIRSDVGGINIQSDANLDDAITIRVDGGTASEITIHNDQGNTADSIELVSDAGGITLNGAVGGVVFTAGQTKSIIFMPNDVKLDGTVPPGTTDIGTSAQAQFDTLGFDANPNATGDDWVFINWIVPAGYIVDSADLHCYWSHSTAEDAADECVIDGTVNAVAPGEALDAAGTGMAAVTSVIADASASAGTLIKTSLDIEVEDIAVGDLVCIGFFFDESACLMAASGTADVHYFEITYESSE